MKNAVLDENESKPLIKIENRLKRGRKNDKKGETDLKMGVKRELKQGENRNGFELFIICIKKLQYRLLHSVYFDFNTLAA